MHVAKKLNYTEGAAFSIPAIDSQSIIGVVCRLDGCGIIFCRFFVLDDTASKDGPAFSLQPGESFFAAKCGDLGLLKKLWPVIGHVEGYNREVWTLPVFVRTDGPDRFVSEYSDDLELLSERRERGGFPASFGEVDDGLYGYVALERMLMRVLKSRAKSPLD